MATAAQLPEITLTDIVEDWLDAFGAALADGDIPAAAAMFQADSHWRDLLAFSWNIQSISGTSEITAILEQTLAATQPVNFHIPGRRTPPRMVSRAGQAALEAIFAFDTATGPANGVVRLVHNEDNDDANGGEWRAWVLMTALDEIRGHEERTGAHRPDGESYSREFGGDNWLDERNAARAYENHEPEVLVVGGGQSGLAIAACLGQLGVDTLVIDKHEKIGDAWRKRYHALTLHNQVHVNHLPYMPFPPNWPLYIPKDKLANWFEAYAESMELNVWCNTEIGGGSYDEDSGRWDVALAHTDGTTRTIRPQHVVYAVGVSGIPVQPDLPGVADFKGKVIHSHAYTAGQEWAGKKALVLGTGNSGHDLAQDLHANDVDVSLIQRGTSTIVSLEQAQSLYALFEEGPPTEDCDLLATATPYDIMVQGYKLAAIAIQAADKEMLDGLSARGFKHDIGPPDNTGFQMKYLRRGGGYCLNVGCSDLIIAGDVGLLQYDDIEKFVATGAAMKDGSIVEADLLVTATGYKNQREVVRATLGDDIADKIGPVWGFGEERELRNMWQRTPQPGLWFTAGGLPQVRIYSKYLALQIKACQAGLLDKAQS